MMYTCFKNDTHHYVLVVVCILFGSLTLGAQASKWSFHLGFDTAFPTSGTTGGVSSKKLHITDPSNGSVYYTMRTKMPAGVVAGIGYDITPQLSLRYQYKYHMRNFFSIFSDSQNTHDSLLKEAYVIGFMGFRAGFAGYIIFSSSNNVSLNGCWPIWREDMGYKLHVSTGVSVDDYEMGQKVEDTNRGGRSIITFRGDDANKEHITTSEVISLQHNPNSSGREWSLLMSGALSKEMRWGHSLRVEVGYKWSLPATRLDNNHIVHDLTYSHYSKDTEGQVYESYRYVSGPVRFPISMTGFYGNITYGFRLFGAKDRM